MCIVSAKITELWRRLKCQQDDTSWVWYYLYSVVGWPQFPYIRGLVLSAARCNCRSLSSIPRREELQSPNSSHIVKLLSETNDGRSRRPERVVSSATYAPAKTQEREGVSYQTAYGGNCYSHVSSLMYPVMLHCKGSEMSAGWHFLSLIFRF